MEVEKYEFGGSAREKTRKHVKTNIPSQLVLNDRNKWERTTSVAKLPCDAIKTPDFNHTDLRIVT